MKIELKQNYRQQQVSIYSGAQGVRFMIKYYDNDEGLILNDSELSELINSLKCIRKSIKNG